MFVPTHYKLKSMRASSDKYGPCEICGKHVAEVYLLTKYTEYAQGRFTCGNTLFGHHDCLLVQAATLTQKR